MYPRIDSHFLTIFLKVDFFQCSHVKVLIETLLFIKIELNFLKKFYFWNSDRYWRFCTILHETLLFSQNLMKIFQIFCGSSLTHRKYFHQILLNLEHMEIYAAVHFTYAILYLKKFNLFHFWPARFLATTALNSFSIKSKVSSGTFTCTHWKKSIFKNFVKKWLSMRGYTFTKNG